MPPKNMTEEKIEQEKAFILKQALDIVGEQGYSKISMRKLATKCNFSHAKIYYYFSNKDEILSALVDDGFNTLKNKTYEMCENLNDPKDKFIAILNQIYNFGINESNYFNLMFGIEVPKCSDFISNIDSSKPIAQKENALEFYQYFKQIVSNFSSSKNVELSTNDILNIFIQIAGIVWLENSRILKEIGHDKHELFNNTIKNIIEYIDLKSKQI